MSFKLSLASAALFSAVGACFGMITSTQADLLNLTLDGVKFTDGGAASGTFTFNTTTNALSNISITTTPGSVMPGTTYTGAPITWISPTMMPLCTGPVSCFDFQANSAQAGGAALAGLQLAIASLPTTASPSVPIIQSTLFNGGSFECDFCFTEFEDGRFITAGSIDIAGMPTFQAPSSVLDCPA
jgi:hypothetical protein